MRFLSPDPTGAGRLHWERPELRVYGADYPTADGTCLRDYVHVNDLADAHVRALKYLEKGSESLANNPGTGRGHSVLEVIQSSRPRKAPLDGRFDERSDHDCRAILLFSWPIRRKRKECWDELPNTISPTLSRVRGTGCRKLEDLQSCRMVPDFHIRI